MNRLSIKVSDIYQVLQLYDKIKVYFCATESGTYIELSDESNRPSLNINQEIYLFSDVSGSTSRWYKVAYFNSSTLAESELSDSMLGGQAEKTGFSFENYTPPLGEWGEVITADDLRYTYLWGNDLTGGDSAATAYKDSQLRWAVTAALADFEKFLKIDIRRRKYVTKPDSSLIRATKWRVGVDYTDEEDTYDFEPDQWTNFGFLKLRHRPVIQINRAILYTVVRGQLIDLLNQKWVRLNKKFGQCNFYPTTQLAYGPFTVSANFYRWSIGSNYPDGYEFDYETGFESSAFLPEDLRDLIGKWAAIKTLNIVGDGFTAGIASQSVGLDGLSESVSTTMSATSAWFGARIKQYSDEIKDWLARNKNAYNIPMSFVGGG